VSEQEATTLVGEPLAVATDAGQISSRSVVPLTGSIRLRIVCAAMLLGCAVWACWPLGGAGALPTIKPFKPDTNVKLVAKKSLDLAAFRAPLWVVPPPPPAPPGPPALPPPLKLQLIAIISPDEHNPARAALLYDPDQDKLLTVHEGESLQGRRIEKITEARVHIRDSAGERILALRADAPGGPP
jgi:hypothetical protein